MWFSCFIYLFLKHLSTSVYVLLVLIVNQLGSVVRAATLYKGLGVMYCQNREKKKNIHILAERKKEKYYFLYLRQDGILRSHLIFF